MKYKLFNNSKEGLHCVQACLQMLLYAFGKRVLTLVELDRITAHEPHMFTWMGETLLWLREQGFEVINYESLDYKRFARDGSKYLRGIWDSETYRTQDQYSNLRREQRVAEKMIESDVRLINSRLSLARMRSYLRKGYFMMISINPNVLDGNKGYGSHLVVVKAINESSVVIFDPDFKAPKIFPLSLFRRSISARNKPDFNAILVKA